MRRVDWAAGRHTREGTECRIPDCTWRRARSLVAAGRVWVDVGLLHRWLVDAEAGRQRLQYSAGSMPLLTLVIVGALTVAQVIALRRATNQAVPFPAIVIVILNAVGALGYLYYRSIPDTGQSGAIFPVGQVEYAAAAATFALASAGLFIGGLLGAIPRRATRTVDLRTRDIDELLRRIPRIPLLAACTVPLVMTIGGMGFEDVISRPQYLDIAGPAWMAGVGETLLPIAMVGAALVLFDRTRKAGRGWALLLTVAYIAVLLSKDTRRLAVMPLALLAAYLLQRVHTPPRKSLLLLLGIITAGLTVVLLQLVLALRQQVNGAGLAPYLTALIDNPIGAFELNTGFQGALQNVLSAVPLTGFLAGDVRSLPASELATSLTPLPSALTDWAQIQPLLRVGIYVPFSTLGELAVNGAPVLALYFLVVGYIGSRIQIL